MRGRLDVKTRRRWGGVALVCAMFLMGLTGSWALTVAVDGVSQRYAAQLMDRHAAAVSQAVLDEAGRYRDALTDLAAAAGTQSEFTAEHFAEMTSGLNRRRLPGASSASFAVPVTDAEIPAAQALWRRRGATGLRLEPVGTGLEHLFVVFNRPLDDGPPTHGRDLSKGAEPSDALRASRQSRQVTASRTYVLLKDRNLPPEQRQMSFLLAAPVYGGANTPDAGLFRGWVFMSLRGSDFIAETLRAQSQGAVQVSLADVSDGAARPVVTPSTRIPIAGPLNRRRVIQISQRQWELRIYPSAGLLTDSEKDRPGIAMGVGTFFTVLLTALVGVLAGTRNRALARVDKATAALRDDIERRKDIEARLRRRDGELQHMVLHDPLTGLANRTLFYDRLDHAVVSHNRSGSTLAVLFIDLDGFKQINDERGHSAGDAVLAQVADRLRGCVRTGDTAARVGGDEFMVLAEDITAPHHAEVVAAQIVWALQAPFEIAGGPAQVTASVGVASRQPGGAATDDVVRIADEAMYAAKQAGKDRYLLADASG